MERKNIKTKEEAQQFAQEWQQWQSEQNMSYGECFQWYEYFSGLAKKFNLTEEFVENRII